MTRKIILPIAMIAAGMLSQSVLASNTPFVKPKPKSEQSAPVQPQHAMEPAADPALNMSPEEQRRSGVGVSKDQLPQVPRGGLGLKGPELKGEEGEGGQFVDILNINGGTLFFNKASSRYDFEPGQEESPSEKSGEVNQGAESEDSISTSKNNSQEINKEVLNYSMIV